MVRRDELFSDIKEAREMFSALLDQFHKEKFLNPDTLNKSKTKVCLQLLRGMLDISFKEIVEMIVIPNHYPATEPNLAKVLRQNIYFPYGAKTEEDFLKNDVIAKIKSVDPKIFELIANLQPFWHDDTIETLCKQSNPTKHDQSLQDKKEMVSFALGDGVANQYTAAVYFSHYDNLTLTNEKYPSLTLNNCNSVNVQDCAISSILIINCTGVELIRLRHNFITVINSSVQLYHPSYPGVDVNREKIVIENDTALVYPNVRNHTGRQSRPLPPDHIGGFTYSHFTFKGTDTSILDLIHSAISIVPRYVVFLYEELEKHVIA